MKKGYGLISEIDIADEASWRDKVFITLDIDWASDQVIRYTADLLKSLGMKATWFATHDTVCNVEIQNTPEFELGIHPNFNPLVMQGSPVKGNNASEIISQCLSFAPNAKAVRSHSLTQSSPLLDHLHKTGFKYDLNTFIPLSSDIVVKPYQHCGGIIQVPHIWEDDVHCYYGWHYDWAIKKLLSYEGLVVLDFHPIHIYLNTEEFGRYTSVKDKLHNIEMLDKNICKEYGTRNFLIDFATSVSQVVLTKPELILYENRNHRS